MLSNLNSCHGVFIPTSLQKPPSTLFTPSSAAPPFSGTNTRHYRCYSSSSSYSANQNPNKLNETKRNKRVLNDESIWAKIEHDFTPELLEEHNSSNYTIPETVSYSPKQGGGGSGGGGGGSGGSSASSSLLLDAAIPAKKISALFVKPDMNVECLYRKSGIRENCEVCSSDVVLTDDGFLTCKNPACSILYKDESLDQTAEWRYYGADDNQNNDPTRCGMPVNPLLKESSYGCKVMCEGGS